MASDRIAKNTLLLTIASVIQKIISFGYFAMLADGLGTQNIGKYSFALTFTSIFIIFMDFGLGQLLTREGAKDEEHLQKHITEYFSVKVYLMGIFFVLTIVSALVMDKLFVNVDATDVQLMCIGSVIILLDTLTFTLFSIFRALKRLQWEAASIILYQVVIVAFGITAVRLGASVHWVIGALLLGSVAQCVFLVWVLYKRTPYRLRVERNLRAMKPILIIAAPFAVAGIIYRLTGSIDNVMLKVIAGDSASGWYALAFKLTFALTVLPGAFATSYYPAMSTYLKEKSDNVAPVFEYAMVYMAILSAPIAAGVFVIGGTIIQIVWGEAWYASATALSTLMFGLPFVFFNYPVGNFLNAAGKQRINTINMGIALCVNVALNTWLIPRYTFNGAAISSTVSSVLLVLLGLPWVYRIARFSVLRLALRMSSVLVAAFLMAAVVYETQDSMPLPLVILLAVIVYPFALLLTRAIRIADIRALVAQAIARTSRV